MLKPLDHITCNGFTDYNDNRIGLMETVMVPVGSTSEEML